MKAVIMAGGTGTRLRPFTYVVPKPLLPVGKKPILEIILEQLAKFGFTDVIVTVEYKADLIKSYFGDGAKFGVKLTYFKEPYRLGTAGALGNLKDKLIEPFLLMNSDILTKTNLRKLYDHHISHDAVMTVGIKIYSIQLPFGVIKHVNGRIIDIEEKPSSEYAVLAGIYVINPEVLSLIPGDKYMDITEVITKLIKENRKIATYLISEYWQDIGNLSDFQKTNVDIINWENL